MVGRRITSVVALEQGGGPRDGQFDDKVCAESLAADDVVGSLKDRWVLGVRRKGKQLWVELSDTRSGACTACLLLHFGMTGACIIRGHDVPVYKSFSVDTSSWPPRFTKLELELRDTKGQCCALAYTDPRRFGRILFRGADALSHPPLSSLAPDPLTAAPPLTAEETCAKLRGVATPIKAVLLDQSRLVCGVGNWVADETLYQARVLPHAAAGSLSDAQVAEVLRCLLHVCRTACSCHADSSRFPQEWLFHHRWANQTSGSLTCSIGRIHFAEVGGRTTAYLPAVQKGGAAAVVAAAGKPARPAAAKPAAGAKKVAKKATATPSASTDEGAKGARVRSEPSAEAASPGSCKRTAEAVEKVRAARETRKRRRA